MENEIAQGTNVSGFITIDTSWDLAGSPYIVTGDINVAGGVTLTIEPGVEVRFDGDYSIYVDGTLIAVGNEINRINITSNNPSPLPGDWNKIQINSSGYAEIEYSNISYGSSGIYLYSSPDNKIINNNIVLNKYQGIHTYSSTVNNIANNNISNNGCGVLLNYSDYNYITNNYILNNGYGIHIFWSDNVNIIGNSLLYDSNGLYIQNSERTMVRGNNISSNSAEGIRAQTSDRVTVTFNEIWNNEYGIRLFSSFNYLIHHNNFIDNSVLQAYDENWGGTSWDNGWPSGGNYWSDYVGDDNFLGPNQDFPGSDGLGDTPYKFSVNSKDNYPLMEPLPDLEVENSDMVFDPQSPVKNGTGIFINATIHNIGVGNCSDIIVRFYNGDPIYPGSYQIGSDRFIPSINSSEEETVGVQWNASPIGTHYIYVVVDQNQSIIEMDEGNNVASKVIEVIEILPPTLYLDAIGEDVVLNWKKPSTPGISRYLIYRSTSQTGFNFSNVYVNTSLHNDSGIIPLRTTWNDTGAASDKASQQFYYTIRTVYKSGEISSTSRTVGKWTKTFPKGVSTFSLPLEPLKNMTIDNCLNSMNARYIKWMHTGLRKWMKHGDGVVNDTQMKLGEGYEVKFDSQTNYTFIGMPGAMIMRDDDNGFLGFDSDSEAKNLTVTLQSNGDVNLTWQEPISMSDGWYEVYYSNKRDGFFGTFNMSCFSACPPVNFGNIKTTHLNALANDSGTHLYYMVVPFNTSGVRGTSTYSIGIWTEGYLAQYDTFGIPLKLSSNQTADWYCENINNTVGINYFDISAQWWSWHSTIMPEGAYDPILEMAEGYQISTSGATKFTFIGI